MDESNSPHRVTFCMQDDKLRLYFAFRIPREEWDRFREAGFTWTMKQKENGGCDMSAPWTPEREDMALELAGEIGDEDQPREERSADRAERFEAYQAKREGEALALAGAYESGPSVHGHQNAARAERAAARHDRIGTRAVSQWRKAEYWTSRTAGVIRHALYLEKPEVRHRRIKTIEADIRRIEKDRNDAAAKWRAWQKIAAMQDAEKQTKAAEYMANFSHTYFQHPEKPDLEKRSLWTLITDHGLTGAQAAALYLAEYGDPHAYPSRWLEHYKMRLAYENQMLAAQGGTSANVEIVPGGFFGRFQVQKISKDKAGRVSKIFFKSEDGDLRGVDAEKLKAEDFRPATVEEAAAFEVAKKEGKAGAKKQAPLINPTKEAAQALCDSWNAATKAREEADKLKGYYCSSNYGTAKVIEMTAAEYTADTKRGDWYGTREITPDGRILCRWNYNGENKGAPAPAFRLRVRCTISAAVHIIILTDKPGAALPLAPQVEAVAK